MPTLPRSIAYTLLAFAAVTLAACGAEAPAPEALPADVETDAVEAGADAFAPDFTLTDLNGEDFTLSDHRGEIVVLNFWATWCLPCIAEMPDLEALHQELGDGGVRIVGISQDTGGADEVRPFVERLGVTYPLLPDPAFQVASRYGGVSVLPTTIFIGRDGRVAKEEMGALHASELRAIIEELGANGAAPLDG